ncbi:DUF3775 domain-containing protein [Methylomagnum sp.]
MSSNRLDEPVLRAKIEELITLDNQHQSRWEEKHPSGVQEVDFQKPGQVADTLNNEAKTDVGAVLESLSNDDLAYVMALAWSGSDNETDESGVAFENYLDDAKKQVDDMTVDYLKAKPLGRYLSLGLERLEKAT